MASSSCYHVAALWPQDTLGIIRFVRLGLSSGVFDPTSAIRNVPDSEIHIDSSISCDPSTQNGWCFSKS